VHPRDRAPTAYWLIPAVVVFLRILPYLYALSLDPAPGAAVLQVGYLPKDFLAYLAFTRQAIEAPSLFFYDPFTTDPQTARFIFPFFWLLGRLSALTGATPTLLLEVARAPLIFVFFAVLWWFLRPILPDVSTRLIAAALVAFAGGIEGLVRPFATTLPPDAAAQLLGNTGYLLGWSTFAAAFNPLWIAGLTLTLATLHPLLRPHGPRNVRELAGAALGLFATFWIHPYSAIVVIAVAGTYVISGWIFEHRIDRGRLLGAAALILPLAIIGGISIWQLQDPVYRTASAGALGPNAVAPFWLPITLGALLVFALRGARTWVIEEHPYRLALFAWVGAIVLLHSSPVLNGYHFVFQLHLPVAIVAAVGLRESVRGWHTRGVRARLATAGLIAALVPSMFFVTRDSLADVAQQNQIPAAYVDVIAALREMPAGNALVPASLGNLVPAFTQHRVWVGHWFLTPDAVARATQYQKLAGEEIDTERLLRFVNEHSVQYAVVSHHRTEAWLEILGDRVVDRQQYRELDLLVLGPSVVAAGPR